MEINDELVTLGKYFKDRQRKAPAAQVKDESNVYQGGGLKNDQLERLIGCVASGLLANPRFDIDAKPIEIADRIVAIAIEIDANVDWLKMKNPAG